MYERILVPVDGSATANIGLEEAIKLAQLTGATVRLIHVVEELILATGYEGYAFDTAGLLESLLKAGKGVLEQAKAKVEAAGVKVETVMVERMASRASDAVIDEAVQWKAELIVIGTHGRRGMSRIILGSDAEQIVRLSPVPVLLVRSSD